MQEGLIVKLIFNREEALACIIALEKERPYGWRDDALSKLLARMGLSPKKSAH